ncbi:MAG: 5-enolpyruvylshikimate-3-phosphate synthase, partial [Gammaproteobacteria bacterium]|nr:5-enolpyruvylshikimate-3-phosphate synthase [Gammaproteobacteria bacterium]
STVITGDFTSASYLVACALLFPGVSTFTNVDLNNLQGEKIIFDLVNMLNVTMHYEADSHVLIIDNQHEYLSGDIEISVKDGPNITPTLAAIGAYVEGEFVVRDATVCQYHKCNRIRTMVEELKKFGVNIRPIFKNNLWDGFVIKGKRSYPGNVTFSTDFRDHRIIMSLFIAALRAESTSFFSVDNMNLIKDSFPGFMNVFKTEKEKVV